MKKKITFLLTLLAMVIIASPIIKSNAKEPTAKELLKNAVTQMEGYESIAFSYDSIRNYSDDSSTRYRHGVTISDSKYNYGVYVDNSQSNKGWQEYEMDGTTYRKGYDSSAWTKYSNSNPFSTNKQGLEYDLSNYKKASISSISNKYYTVKITPKDKDSSWSKAYVTIHKKTGLATKIKFTLKKKTFTYLNSTETYTVTGGTYTYSNISYGNSAIALPDELK